jgi:hypothetical protein
MSIIMIQHLARIALSAWISAALMVGPAVASLECRRCCGAPISVSAATCHAEPVGSCCGKQTIPPDQPTQPHPHCPKCESKRPHPVVVRDALVLHWMLQAAAFCEPVRFELPTAAADGSPRELRLADLGTPPPRVLFCSWQE